MASRYRYAQACRNRGDTLASAAYSEERMREQAERVRSKRMEDSKTAKMLKELQWPSWEVTDLFITLHRNIFLTISRISTCVFETVRVVFIIINICIYMVYNCISVFRCIFPRSDHTIIYTCRTTAHTY